MRVAPWGRARLRSPSTRTCRRRSAPLYPTSTPDGIGRAPRGINDGKGFVFISHLGEVFPSGFLPVSAGNIRTNPWPRSIDIPPSSPDSAMPPTRRANAGPASSAKSVAAHAPGPTLSPATSSPKNPAASTSPRWPPSRPDRITPPAMPSLSVGALSRHQGGRGGNMPGALSLFSRRG
jgi:hypothetical protein